MMIKKVEFFLLRVQLGKPRISGVFLRFKPLFCQSTPTNTTKVAEQFYLGVLRHPTKFQAKILTRKFYSLEENQNIQLMLSQMFGLF